MNLSAADLGFVSIENKVILISGASSGIGRATVKLLAKAGAKTIAVARNYTKLKILADEISASGHPAPLIIQADVGRELDCNAVMAQCLDHFGCLDVLVNNAAIGFPAEIYRCTTADYERTMATNIDGAFFLTRAALEPMREKRSGHIIMISSDAGTNGSGVAPIYAISKHALEGLTASLRYQLEGWVAQGIYIRLTNIWPGTVDSEYWGERQVPRHTFMSCAEMASFLVQAIACQPLANITALRVQQFKHSDDKTAADWFEKHKR